MRAFMTSSIDYKKVVGQLKFGDSVFPSMTEKPEYIQTLGEAISWVKNNITELEKELASSGVLLFLSLIHI